MESFEVRLKAIRYEAQGISSFEFRPMPGRELAPFTAGAHIDVHLPNGLMRNYSLCNAQSERDRYVIGVNRDPNSRGGSRFMHESLHVGDVLTIGAPRNNFALHEDAEHTVLIAGGIGITPLWCMIQRLEALGRSWELHYSARNRQAAAFLDELRALGEPARSRLHLNFDAESGGKFLDLRAIVAAAPNSAHLYCCGPLPMLEALEQYWDDAGVADQLYTERFRPAVVAGDGEGGTVTFTENGTTLEADGTTPILDAAEEAGVLMPSGCRMGICFGCVLPLREGAVRDLRTGEVTTASPGDGVLVQTCISAAAGACAIDH